MNISDVGAIYLSSPHYPKNYPSNVNCVWYFIESTPGTFVITVIDLQSEWFDSLIIGRGRNISDDFGVRLSLWYYPKTILIEEMAIWVNFASNHAVTFRGFLIEIERKGSNGKLIYS